MKKGYKRGPQTEEHKRKISEATKGRKSPKYWLGKKMPEEMRKKMIISRTGEKNYLWKGEEGTYGTMHSWVRTWKGTPMKCEVCGIEGRKYYDWANVDHKYKRKLEDYVRMCRSCHRKHDKNLKGQRIKRYIFSNEKTKIDIINNVHPKE